MDFKTAILTCLKEKYVDFNGRGSRAEYWYFFLFMVAVNIVGYILGMFIPFISLLITIALFLPTITAGVRRLHDTNKTGWLMLIGLIPLIGGLILLFLLAQKGTDADNTYGAKPSA